MSEVIALVNNQNFQRNFEMNKNSWQKEMYDDVFAKMTIGSDLRKQKALHEAAFLMDVLKLDDGAKILDVPCGTGRHSVEFAKRGYQVTAIDISSACLKIAKRQSAHKNIQYKLGDMAKLQGYRGQFDAVTNLFTSFGYFATDEENKRVLKQMVNCLRPGGKLALNTINRNFLLSIYQPALWSSEDGVVTVQASIYDSKTKYNESYVCIVNDRKKMGSARYHRLRLYSPNEMIALMKSCGLTKVETYGDFEGNKLNRKTSTHPIYIGHKK